MELWIRSQDRLTLMKVEGIEYLYENNKHIIAGHEVHGFVFIGEYKTKERALEVLDEIQNILNLKDMYKYDRELILKSWDNFDAEQVKIVREQMSVYKMPEE